jgi:hypothetical protein
MEEQTNNPFRKYIFLLLVDGVGGVSSRRLLKSVSHRPTTMGRATRAARATLIGSNDPTIGIVSLRNVNVGIFFELEGGVSTYKLRAIHDLAGVKAPACLWPWRYGCHIPTRSRLAMTLSVTWLINDANPDI